MALALERTDGEGGGGYATYPTPVSKSRAFGQGWCLGIDYHLLVGEGSSPVATPSLFFASGEPQTAVGLLRTYFLQARPEMQYDYITEIISS